MCTACLVCITVYNDVAGSLYRHPVVVTNQELDHALLPHPASKQYLCASLV